MDMVIQFMALKQLYRIFYTSHLLAQNILCVITYNLEITFGYKRDGTYNFPELDPLFEIPLLPEAAPRRLKEKEFGVDS